MSQEIALLKETNNQIAVRHGLPPVGSTMINQYGIEWLVDGHLFVPTLSTLSRGTDPDVDDPRDLYPVILPQNFSPRLTNFIAETDRCTSKVIVPLDTLPYLRPHSAHPYGHWIDGLDSPHRILMFLDAAHAHETIIAHEIGHIWIDLVEDCEDYRIFNDLSDTPKVHQWTSLQSFVLDNKVNEVLREKGFDMSVIENDVEESLISFAAAIRSGYRPPTAREAAFVASTLATAMLDYEAGAQNTLQSLDMASTVFRQDLPDVYELACHLAASVRRHGYADRASIRKAVDECALLSFAFVGEPLDLDTDFVEAVPTEDYNDKYPEYFPGIPVAAKLEIARAMARLKIPGGSECRLEYLSTGSAQVKFCQQSGEWTEPILLKNLRRLPQSAAFAGSNPMLQRGRLAMNKSIISPAPDHHPSFPPLGKVSGRRTYAPGLAVFLSRVRLEEQLGGEHPYGYALNNPVTYTDPTGLQPCFQSSCDTYPGGPCAYAKSIGDDFGQFGGVVCCNGKKYTCVWKNPGSYPGMGKCVGVHEGTHTGQVDCPPTGYVRPHWRTPGDKDKNECHAYIIGTACLVAEQKKDCSKLTGNARKKCNTAYMDRICSDCDIMKNQYSCTTLPQICSKCPKKP